MNSSEPKKIVPLRRKLEETRGMLVWVLGAIDRFNDSAEPPMCPEGYEDQQNCGGDCAACWFNVALRHARGQE